MFKAFWTKVESLIGGIPLCLVTFTLLGKVSGFVWPVPTGTFKYTRTDYWKIKNLHIIKQIYLDLPPHLRSTVTKLHLKFQIETGRYQKPHAVPVEKRTCILCRQLNREWDPFPASMHSIQRIIWIYNHISSRNTNMAAEEKWRIL